MLGHERENAEIKEETFPYDYVQEEEVTEAGIAQWERRAVRHGLVKPGKIRKGEQAGVLA